MHNITFSGRLRGYFGSFPTPYFLDKIWRMMASVSSSFRFDLRTVLIMWHFYFSFWEQNKLNHYAENSLQLYCHYWIRAFHVAFTSILNSTDMVIIFFSISCANIISDKSYSIALWEFSEREPVTVLDSFISGWKTIPTVNLWYSGSNSQILSHNVVSRVQTRSYYGHETNWQNQ